MSQALNIIHKKEKSEKKICEDEKNNFIVNKKINIEINNIYNGNISLDTCFCYKDNYYKKNSDKDIIFINKNDFIVDDKDEVNNDILSILSDLNKNIEFNIQENENKNKNSKECQEIINILNNPLNNIKNSKNNKNLCSPFKPLLKPKKISMAGKIIYNTYKKENNKNNNGNSKNFNKRDNDKNDKN